MRQYLYIFLIGIIPVFSGYYFVGETTSSESFPCKNGLMSSAWYERGVNEDIPPIGNLPKDFLVLVDTTITSTSKISFSEDYLRRKAAGLDTNWHDWNWSDWHSLNHIQRLEKIAKEKKKYIEKADSIHAINQKLPKVWIINNSDSSISIQMQDWSYICVLEALSKNQGWRPIQYWRFSRCGNSYFYKEFPPHIANSFLTVLPSMGDYSTKCRFKLLGKNRFYYSNEFPGRINYCEFEEDSTASSQSSYTQKEMPLFKLDSFVDLVH